MRGEELSITLVQIPLNDEALAALFLGPNDPVNGAPADASARRRRPNCWKRAFMAELRSLHLSAAPPERSVIKELADAYLAAVASSG
jgi:hypothetical protein